MKRIAFLVFAAMMLLGVQNSFAGTKTEKIKVNGNCDMCKDRIEKTVKAVDGVSTADWNKKTKVLQITFDDSKTNVQQIEKLVARAGHDTELYKADDETYKNLPACCHYDRTRTDIKPDAKSDKKADMSPKK